MLTEASRVDWDLWSALIGLSHATSVRSSALLRISAPTKSTLPDGPEGGHSVRIATIGSIRVALRIGRTHARRAQRPRIAGATINVAGSAASIP
jgi:hypothetical protein